MHKLHSLVLSPPATNGEEKITHEVMTSHSRAKMNEQWQRLHSKGPSCSMPATFMVMRKDIKRK
jgi:hypothetical protein